MNVATNLAMIFHEMDLLQKYGEAAALGFQLVEVSEPFGVGAKKLLREAEHRDIKHVLINAPTDNWSEGFRGLVVLPEQSSKYVKSLEIAVQYAKKLNMQKVHVMADIVEQTNENCEVYFVWLESITYLIEPICEAAIPGYFINSYSEGANRFELISEEIVLLRRYKCRKKSTSELKNYDLFHVQQICGQLTTIIEMLAPFIGHVQIAQIPGRIIGIFSGCILWTYILTALIEFIS